MSGLLDRPLVFWKENDMPSGRPWHLSRYLPKVLEIEGIGKQTRMIDSLEHLSSIVCLGALMILALESTFRSLFPRHRPSVHRSVSI